MSVQYGTALFDDSSGSHVAVESMPRWKRKDESERVKERFHGAFTGGFSAGYFNTVGSKEGWAPSSFRSSRKDKASGASSTISPKYSRPEDFMDEEDLRDQEDSITLVPVSDTIDSRSGKSLLELGLTSIASMQAAGSAELSLDSRIRSLVTGGAAGDDDARSLSAKSAWSSVPAVDAVGYGILSKMGWRPGQGIGPKSKKKFDLGDRSGSVEHEIAPKNTVLSVRPSNNSHGLGYDIDMPELPVLLASRTGDDSRDSSERSGLNPRTKKRKLAMNLSIAASYEDDDEDGLEEVRSNWNPKYDTKEVLKSDKPRFVRPMKKLSRNGQNISSEKEPRAQFVKRRCADGLPVPTGFVLSSRPLYKGNDYPLPDVLVAVLNDQLAEISNRVENMKNIERNGATILTSKNDGGENTTTLDSKSRAQLLKEPQLPGQSVFDLLSKDALKRIADIKDGRNVIPLDRKPDETLKVNSEVKLEIKTEISPDLKPEVKPSVVPGMESDEKLGSGISASKAEDDEVDNLPYLSQDIAHEALSNTKYPYAEDLEKRQRYLNVLKVYSDQTGTSGTFAASLKKIRPTSFSHETWINELNEFTRVAIVFRPLKGAIASRFTSSTGRPTNDTGIQTPAEYDASTFRVTDFFPERLLSKRFGVPFIGITTDSSEKRSMKPSRDTTQESKPKSEASASSSEVEATIDPNKNSALESDRAPSSLFAMIFGDKAEDSEDDDI
ncbi:hypothetical protein AWJ20_4097 [Sugiyamaella lignohabitans]|uniref:G-patch domain-containing protein n=1 Tax=Sugiyamaella lignohabitans TaxID=796027 RepID=A0A167C6U2_9ASCO|nr:uncharacterized protein AWJ20_4097 [Sugiyamaella lignohabitans]ANB11293.1 hypothetical protein AWJ20_4097 [Sugiyamaella lignohabitans]